MGVLACDRRGCENIMCDRMSWEYQKYICNECFDELVNLGVRTDIEAFFDTSKSRFDRESSYAYFDKVFKLRYD